MAENCVAMTGDRALECRLIRSTDPRGTGTWMLADDRELRFAVTITVAVRQILGCHRGGGCAAPRSSRTFGSEGIRKAAGCVQHCGR